jgi:hypothetical protein
MKINNFQPPERSTADEQELEFLLRTAPLTQPPASLDRRVLQTVRFHHFARLRTIGIAAGIFGAILTLAVFVHRPQRHEIAQEPVPANDQTSAIAISAMSSSRRIERSASRLDDKGIVGFTGKVPLHGYRYESVRQVWYQDANGKRLCVTIPQSRIVLVPVRTF